ncbi:MAG: ATP-dependent DNA helicase RecG [Chloroflexota bacterium]|nr:ATP-dependent DNA helicase RecG [Chloroflexota bacterium]
MTEDRLRKVLELERAKRFGDRAVTAGLDSFLKNITTHEASQLSSDVFARIQALPLSGYRSLSPAKRKLWIEDTLRVLKSRQNGDGEAAAGAGEAGSRKLEAGSKVPEHLRSRGDESGRDDASPRRGDGRAVATARKSASTQPRLAQAQARFSPGELEGLGVDAPICALKRVPFALGVKFDKLNVHTLRDLLLFFPRRHVDYGDPVPVAQLEHGREQTVRAQVWSAKERQMGPRMRSTEATIGDSSGMMQCVWFNQPWIAKQLPINAEIVVSGRVSERQGRPCFDNPEWETWSQDLLHTGRLVPIYPLTAGLQNRTVRRVMQEAIDRFGDKLPDPLPEEMRDRLRLEPIAPAVTQMHYPTDRPALERARRRLAFEELLPIQLTMQLRRRMFQRSAPAEPVPLSAAIESEFISALPFTLTGAQERVLFDVLNDLRRPVPMSRLVQGDVGSGKTVIAAAALVAAITNGRQGVMMAPTEILAEQHFRTLKQLFNANGSDGPVVSARPPFLDPIRSPELFERRDRAGEVRIALLTGSLRAKERRELYEALERGEIDIACGTHALIQGGVRFRDLGVVVVDEQHRFGVMQRAALREKGAHAAHTPHMLVMTATPIPRTLALTLYGDLDISVVDELPPGRQPIKTTWVGPDERGDAERFVREQVELGRQAFVICPLVEESETLDVKSATAEYERLRRLVYPDLRVELVHGRMSAKAKDGVMRRFRNGDADILVSTAVIEVGIDIPNASVMMIEGADRFGLAQLHQFRGRVGRGADQSYCLLLSDEPSEEARKRLELMEETSDGFKLAEADMAIRGPGQFFGTKQSGLPGLKVARLTDVKLIELTRTEATRMLDEDLGLTKPEHHALNRQVARLMDSIVDEEH